MESPHLEIYPNGPDWCWIIKALLVAALIVGAALFIAKYSQGILFIAAVLLIVTFPWSIIFIIAMFIGFICKVIELLLS